MTTDILDLIDNALLDSMSVDAMRWAPDAERVDDEADATADEFATGGSLRMETWPSSEVTAPVRYQVERPDGTLLYQVVISRQYAIWPYVHDWRTGALHIGGQVIHPPWVMRVSFRRDSHWERWMVTDDQSRLTFFPR